VRFHSVGDGAAVPGMAPWWQGWPHRADGDGGDTPDVTTWPLASAERASVPLQGFRRTLSRVRRAHRPYKSGCHSVAGADIGLTAQYSTVAGMASLGGLAEQRRDMTPRRVRETACTCRCQSIKWLGRGSRYGGGVPAGASSEADLTRGGVQPSSEAGLARGGI
jgi:hypothetical protein